MKKPEIYLTSNCESSLEDIEITPLNWSQNPSPFSTAEAINVPRQGWTLSSAQLDPHKRGDHSDYQTQSGDIVHWKQEDGPYEPLYECIAYGLGCQVGVSSPPITAAFATTTEGVIILGTVSFALFTATLFNSTEEKRIQFFKNCDKSSFICESVLAVWWRNYDWADKFDSIAIGKLPESPNKYYYYVFDRSHIFRGPKRERPDEIIDNVDITRCLWHHPEYFELNFSKCSPFIEKIENIPNRLIKKTCFSQADKLSTIDVKNSTLYQVMAEELSSFLVRGKLTLRGELENYFSSLV